MLFAFTAISAHLALSHIRFTAQVDFAVSDGYFAYCIVGSAGWAHINTRHHINPSPFDVVTPAKSGISQLPVGCVCVAFIL